MPVPLKDYGRVHAVSLGRALLGNQQSSCAGAMQDSHRGAASFGGVAQVTYTGGPYLTPLRQ